MKLTVKKAARIKTEGRYPDGGNLFLQVTGQGYRSWLFRYKVRGRDRYMGLGSTREVSLEDARDAARAARRQLRDGIDPLDAKKGARSTAKAAKTFTEATREYYATKFHEWENPKHRAQFINTLKDYADPIIGNMLVGDITTQDVLRVLEQPVKAAKVQPPTLWHNRTETASRVRQRIEKVMAWCTVRGYRTGDNPARWTGHLKEAGLPSRAKVAPVKHHASMPWADLPEFVERLRAREAVAARALEFVILTAARVGEVTQAKWADIDFERRMWNVPAGTTKARRVIRRPLCDRLVALLKSLPREEGNEFIFVGSKEGAGISNMAMPMLLRRMKIDAVVHGFRATFRTWAVDRSGFPKWVAEAQISHAKGDALEEAYERSDHLDHRTRLMEMWSAFVDGFIDGRPIQDDWNVVEIGTRLLA